ncbi:hypothetical protein J8M50_27625 [Streptomyces acidiscabies]|nr:hypothetical protein [Streptomyces acidiscabies]MBZ3914156.1 hypothetical protein [Streptomyces acidiscabies]
MIDAIHPFGLMVGRFFRGTSKGLLRVAYGVDHDEGDDVDDEEEVGEVDPDLAFVLRFSG